MHEFTRFPFTGSVSRSNGRVWHWQLNIIGGGVIDQGTAFCEVDDGAEALDAMHAARRKALAELREQMEETNG